MSKVHFIDNNLAYCSEAAAIAVTTKPDLFTPGDKPISTPRGKIAPWGSDNNLPAHVAKLIEKSEVISSNINFLVETAYGHGIKPMMRIKGDDGQVRYEDCEDERVLKFFEDNDIGGYFLEQLYDLVTFSTVFPEIVVNGGGDSIVSLRHLEATFSRYGSIEENRGRITKHYYNSFEEGAVKGKLFVTPVLSRYNTLNEMQEAVTKGERRFVLELPMPTPGRIYYGRPAWWSIFSSGWFDISEMLPKFKSR